MSKTADEGVINSLLGHASLNISDMIGELRGKVSHAPNDLVRVKVNFPRHAAPVTSLYVAEAILAAEVHRKLHLLDVDVSIGKDAGEIVKRGKTDATSSAYKQSVILRVRVSADVQPGR